MTYSPPDDSLTKQEVKAAYGVSTRTVQRHISDLLRVGDRQALSSLHLCTDDGERWSGTEVTAELIEEVNRSGRKPRWYLDPPYALEQFGMKGPQNVTPSSPTNQARKDDADKTASVADDNVAVLRARNDWLEDENASLKVQLKDSTESRKADRELQERNIELLQELLKVFKGEGPLPARTPKAIPVSSQPVRDAEVIPTSRSETQNSTNPKSNTASKQPTPTKRSTATKPPASTASRKRRPTAPKARSTQASTKPAVTGTVAKPRKTTPKKAANNKPADKTTTQKTAQSKPKRTVLGTLSRFFRG